MLIAKITPEANSSGGGGGRSFFVRSAICEMNVHGSKLVRARFNSVEGGGEAMNIAVKPVCVADGVQQREGGGRVAGRKADSCSTTNSRLHKHTAALRQRPTDGSARSRSLALKREVAAKGPGRNVENVLSVFPLAASTTIDYYYFFQLVINYYQLLLQTFHI